MCLLPAKESRRVECSRFQRAIEPHLGVQDALLLMRQSVDLLERRAAVRTIRASGSLIVQLTRARRHGVAVYGLRGVPAA